MLTRIEGRASVFRRVFFGEEPLDEPIALSLYVEANHGLVLRTEVEALERDYQQLGTPIPAWVRRVGGAG